MFYLKSNKIVNITLASTLSHRLGYSFIIFNAYENVDPDLFFKIKECKRTREHKFTLWKEQGRFYIRTYSFSQRQEGP